jgi:hypothetical protein
VLGVKLVHSFIDDCHHSPEASVVHVGLILVPSGLMTSKVTTLPAVGLSLTVYVADTVTEPFTGTWLGVAAMMRRSVLAGAVHVMSGPDAEMGVPFWSGVLPDVVMGPGVLLVTMTVHLPSAPVVQVGRCLDPAQQQQQQQQHTYTQGQRFSRALGCMGHRLQAFLTIDEVSAGTHAAGQKAPGGTYLLSSVRVYAGKEKQL